MCSSGIGHVGQEIVSSSAGVTKLRWHCSKESTVPLCLDRELSSTEDRVKNVTVKKLKQPL